jgi:hypothetical protein
LRGGGQQRYFPLKSTTLASLRVLRQEWHEELQMVEDAMLVACGTRAAVKFAALFCRPFDLVIELDAFRSIITPAQMALLWGTSHVPRPGGAFRNLYSHGAGNPKRAGSAIAREGEKLTGRVVEKCFADNVCHLRERNANEITSVRHFDNGPLPQSRYRLRESLGSLMPAGPPALTLLGIVEKSLPCFPCAMNAFPFMR